MDEYIIKLEIKQSSTTFRNCSEIEIIDYIFKDKIRKDREIDDLKAKLEELSLKLQSNQKGFFTLSESVSEVWDNKEEDDWEDIL